MIKHHEVAIIGGGPCGLFALKHCLENKLDAILYEASPAIGGAWRGHSNHIDFQASISKTWLKASDFPMSEDLPDFLKASEYLTYLESYATRFNLWPCIVTNCRVLRRDRVRTKWRLHLQIQNHSDPERKFYAKEHHERIIIATGLAQKPHVPQNFAALQKRSDIATLHSSEAYTQFRQLQIQCSGKTVLIIGAGESAQDLAHAISSRTRASRILLSMRNGKWFMPELRDESSELPSNLVSRKTYFLFQFPSFRRAYEDFVEHNFGIGGHGIPAWAPKMSHWDEFLAKRSRFLVDAVRQGTIVPAGAVTRIPTGHGDPSFAFEHLLCEYDVDVVIYATGYKFSHLAGTTLPEPGRCHMFVFPNREDDTAAYVGFARPILGSIPSIGELQGLFVARQWANVGPPLPDSGKQRERCAAKARTFFQGQLKGTIVRQLEYCDCLKSQMGLTYLAWYLPPLDAFFAFRKGLAAWYSLFMAPYCPAETCLLLDNAKQETAMHHICSNWQMWRERRAAGKRPASMTWISLKFMISSPRFWRGFC